MDVHLVQLLVDFAIILIVLLCQIQPPCKMTSDASADLDELHHQRAVCQSE